MSASRVRTFVEMESHPMIPMQQHWDMNMHTNMQMQVEAHSHAAPSSSTTLSRTGKRQRTDAGISNIGVRIQQAMRQAQAMRQTMSTMQQHNTQHRTSTPTGIMNTTASASPQQAARIQSLRAPVPVSPMNTPMNTSQHPVQSMSMCVEDMDLQGTTTRTHWVCDTCGSSTMDHSTGCMHEESSLRCVSDDY